MKTMKKLVSLSLVAVMMFALVACGGSDIVGTWSATEMGIKVTYTFEDDGTGSAETLGMKMDLEYEVDGDEITMKVSMMGVSEEDTYKFKIDGDTLKLTKDGETLELTRE